MKLILFLLSISWALALSIKPEKVFMIVCLIAFVWIIMLEKALRPKKKNVFIPLK